MMPGYRPGAKARRSVMNISWAIIGMLLLAGCLEQVQSTRIPSGSLSNFLLHLQQGELDDARTYFAPGLVTPSASLDSSIKTASERVRAYEIKDKKSDTK